MRSTPGRTLAVLLGTALVLAVGLAPAAAQDWKGRGRVQGVIKSQETGAPIADATVTIYREDDTAAGPEAVSTDDRGRWSYLGLARGTWTIVVEHPEYVTVESATSVRETGPPPKPINIEMRSLQSLIDEETAKRSAALRTKLEHANALLGEGKYAEARAEFELSLEDIDEASQPEVLIAIARTHYLEENTPATIDTLEKILAINPDHVESLRLISSLLVSEGRSDEAAQYIARLPTGEKLDPNAILNQAIDKYNAQDLEGALADIDTVVVNYPEFTEAYYYRGLLNLNLSHNDEARADFNKLLELAPEHPKREEVEQYLEYLESASE